jgi:hypothetical protein
MKLPDNPTPEQIKTIVQAAIRNDLEDDAIVSSVEVTGGTVKALYTTEGRNFEAVYESGTWTKGPVDAKETADFSTELGEAMYTLFGE